MNRPAWTRVLTGVAVLALTGGVVATAGALPDPAPPDPVAPQRVALPAGDAVRVCPPAPRLLQTADAPGTDEALAARALTTTTVRALAPGSQLDRSDLDRAGAVLRAIPPAGEPAGEAAVLAATATALTPEGDLRGLAVADCPAPVEDGWAVAGTVAAGWANRLVLTNPGATPVVVDVTVLTGAGAVAPQPVQGLALAPGESTETLLDGLVPDAGPLAVRVEAAGGRVAAAVLQSRLDGLLPQGVATVGATADPAEHLVVPGAVVRGGSPAPWLRVAVPGEEDAVVRWALLGPDGPVTVEGATAATVPAGTVAEVPLDGLPDGDYTAVVDADVPVLAGVRSRLGASGRPADIGWAAATQPLGDGALVALPDGPDGDVETRLLLAAPDGAADVTVRAVDADGAELAVTEVPVAAHSTTVADLDADRGAEPGDGQAAGWWVEAAGEGAATVTASLLVLADAADGGRLLSVVPVRPLPDPPGDVEVRVPLPGRWP
ncbi:DUF5719 family protein [Quadrisphaera sp. GCM10027208]|uniref:DUF5719 family protein n=1 Tax=Quadrisphaera sp. GCM10027208 TaxID=3273423 RepID=UPI003623157D